MSRTKVLSHVLFSTLAAGCGDDPVKHLADAPPQMDAMIDAAVDAPPDAPAPRAMFLSTVTTASTCGDLAPLTVDLAILNAGTIDLVISAADATGGFTLPNTILPLTIAPGGTSMITIQPPIAVVGTDLAGTNKTGVLTIATNEGAATMHTIDLVSTVMGANLVFVDAADAPVTVALATADGSCPAPQAVFIKNSGNVAIDVTSVFGGSFATGAFSGGTIGAGASVQQDVRALVNGTCTTNETITYQVTGSLCNGDSSGASIGLAASLNITGTSFCFCS